MAAYRFSPMRDKGWLRVSLIGTVALFPIAGIEHSLGFFSEGLAGLKQVGEFLSSGIALMVILGFAGSWVMRGFAYRTRDDDEDEEEPAPSRSPGYSAAPPSPASGRVGKR